MSANPFLHFSRTALAAAAAIVLAAPALAQNTTAALGGRITGGDGKPVAGATVSILHVESRSVSVATTDAEGRYSARGLRVGGPYTVTVTRGGATERRDNVFLTLAETTTLDAQLGTAAQQVVVTGSAVSDRFNSASMGAGTNLSNAQLNALASIQRSLQDYARTDPRLAQTDKERGEISAAGQNTRFNSITIDGVNVNDTFGLESNNLPTIKQPVSIEAIQSVQVNLSNYDVTQKGYTGANVNAVTKSGSNEFKGSLFWVMRDENMVGQRYNRSAGTYFDAAAFKEETKGFTLGGPIVKDKLFFFAAYEDFFSSRTRPDFGAVGAGSGTTVGISQSAIQGAIDVAKSTWGVDAGSAEVPGGLGVSVKDALLKLDWNISDSHRASLRWTKTEQTEPFLVGFSPTGLSLSSYWYNQGKQLESTVAQWFADWTPKFSTEFKLSKRDYASEPVPVNGVRLPQITLRYTGALPAGAPAGTSANSRDLVMGTERSRHFNVLRTETLDAYLGGTYTMGAHELKFGLDRTDNDIYNAFLQDTNGQYRFACENSSATLTYSFGPINCASATAAQVEAAVLENFRLGRPSFYQVQLPLAGRVLGDAVAQWSYAGTGVFLQDTWKVRKGLSLQFGVRVDTLDLPSKPLYNAAAAAATVPGNAATGVRQSGGFGLDNSVTLDGSTLVQPRVGFNWMLPTERRVQLRGGFGLFQGAAANVWLSNPFSNTGMAAGVYSCQNFTACATANAKFNPDPARQPTLTGTPPAPNVDFLSPGLEQPSVWKANLALDAELPPLPVLGRLVAGFEWLNTQTHKAITYEHLNLGAPTRTGPDGRQLFYTAQGYNPACWTATGSSLSSGACAGFRNKALSNPNFNNVLLARETSLGGGDALTFSLAKPAATGLGWSVAYTYTEAKEVSPLTSSVSNSNWQNRNIFNPNEVVLQNSNYLVKDRFSASMTWARAFVGTYKTSVGVFYEGRRGKPYSWTFINDMNGDGIFGNDLMYVPSAPGSGEVEFRGGAAEEARFWDIVNANPALAAAKGGVVGRNNQYAPWVNNFDLRISQELPAWSKRQRASVSLDILNFGNLLNRKWGRIDEIGFPSNRSFVNYAGINAAGKYVYSLGSLEDFVTRQAAGESQWAVQLSLKLEF